VLISFSGWNEMYICSVLSAMCGALLANYYYLVYALI
jgi:hypothetical protein